MARSSKNEDTVLTGPSRGAHLVVGPVVASNFATLCLSFVGHGQGKGREAHERPGVTVGFDLSLCGGQVASTRALLMVTVLPQARRPVRPCGDGGVGSESGLVMPNETISTAH